MFHYVNPGDTVVLNGVEIGTDVLDVILNPDARLLWAFLHRNGLITPVCYSEEKVIWIDASDNETAQL